MFEAVHGSAPDISGKNMANPSGLLSASVLMLQHLGQLDVAMNIANAWYKTIEDGIHTGDIYRGHSKEKVGTREFADAVIARLGQMPDQITPLKLNKDDFRPIIIPEYERPKHAKVLVGADLFVDNDHLTPVQLGALLETYTGGDLKLKMITNRGVKVYPDGLPETFCTDHWRCRFVHQDNSKDVNKMKPIAQNTIPKLMLTLLAEGIDVVKTENLYYFNDKLAFSLGQGE